MKSSGKPSYFFVFIVLLGAITGSLLGDMLAGVPTLGFLKRVYNIGMKTPVVLDLKIISLTFGINFSMNFMSIIGVFLAIILYRKY